MGQEGVWGGGVWANETPRVCAHAGVYITVERRHTRAARNVQNLRKIFFCCCFSCRILWMCLCLFCFFLKCKASRLNCVKRLMIRRWTTLPFFPSQCSLPTFRFRYMKQNLRRPHSSLCFSQEPRILNHPTNPHMHACTNTHTNTYKLVHFRDPGSLRLSGIFKWIVTKKRLCR